MTPDLFLTIIVALALAVLFVCVLVALMAVVNWIRFSPVPKPQPPVSFLLDQSKPENRP